MKKIVLLLFVMLLLSCFTWAKPITLDQAKQVAGNIMVERSSFTNPIIIDNVIERGQAGQPLIYILNFQPAGFVMISAEDAAIPVLGYSSENVYSLSNHPPQFDWLLSSYKKQLTFIQQQNLSASREIKAEWNRLDVPSSLFIPIPNDRAVTPLLSTSWDQNNYYNTLCPTDANGPGGHVYAGCVATAMGQIMKYWSAPASGNGSHSYSNPPYGTLTANFGATTYTWASMPNYLTSNNTAIATLLYHCGVAVNMDYGPDGSGAYSTDAASALVNYFLYKNTLQYRTKSPTYTDATWKTLLKTDLNAGKPLYYDGTDSGLNEAHAWVCDGYDASDNFHMNWGWSGYYNGYYAITSLNPGSISFNTGHGVINGIEPTATATQLSTGFEGSTSIPTGWSIYPTTSSWTISTTSPISGTNSAYYGLTGTGANFSGKQLITPKLTLTSTSTISFYAKRGSTARGEIVKVKYSTTGTTGSYVDFSTPQATVVLNSTATMYTFNVGTYFTGDCYIALETYSATTTSNAKAIWLDSVVGPNLWVNPAPVATLNATTWNAGTLQPGTSYFSGNTFTITNTGLQTLNITGFTDLSATEFSTNLTPSAVAPGASRAFGFSYDPINVGSDGPTTFTVNTNGGNVSVALSGSAVNVLFVDSFENYTDFTQTIPGYTQVDGDLLPTYIISNYTFPGQGYTGSWLVFNSKATTPAMPSSSVFTAHVGSKVASSFAGVPTTSMKHNNDWLITPRIQLSSSNPTFSFYVREANSTYPDRFRVFVSTYATADTTHMVLLSSGMETPTTSWVQKTYSLAAYNGQQVYLAIANYSVDGFCLLVDDLLVSDGQVITPQLGHLSGHVYAYGTTTPVIGATVTIGTKSAVTDDTGYYIIRNIAASTYSATATCTQLNYFDDTHTGVVITNANTTTLNFGLKWAQIASTPTSYNITLDPGDTSAQTLNLSNAGTGTLNYQVYIDRDPLTIGSREVVTGVPTDYSMYTSTGTMRAISSKLRTASRDAGGNDLRTQAILHYDGTPSSAIGLGSAGTWMCAARFTSTELSSYYTNYDLQAVKLRISDLVSGDNVTLKVWQGGADNAPGPEVVSTDVTSLALANLGAWFSYTLPTAINLVSPNEYWIGYSVTVNGATYPSSADSGPMVVGKGAKIYINSVWEDLTSAGATLDYNWNIQGIVDVTGPVWCTMPVTSGTIVAGGNANLSVNFSAADLANRTCTGRLRIVNNSNYHPRGDDYLVPLTMHVNVATVPPSAPTDPSPANNAIDQSLTPTLSWTKHGIVQSSDVVWGPVGNTTSTHVTTNHMTISTPLSEGVLYQWTVTCNNDAGSATGPTWYFTTVGRGIVTGTVTYLNNGVSTVIPNARVTVDGVTMITNSRGQYTFSSMLSGTRHFKVEALNFITYEDDFLVVKNITNTHHMVVTLDADAPGDFMAISGNGTVGLSWTAPPPLGKMAHDDGTAEGWYWVGSPSATTDMFYVRFVAPQAGTITNISVFNRSTSADTAAVWNSIKICPRTAVTGAPGVPNTSSPWATYSNVSITSQSGVWTLLQLATPHAVAAGDTFFVVTQWQNNSPTGPLVGTDESSNSGQSAYTSDGSTWNTIAMNFIMRAYLNNGRNEVTLSSHKEAVHGDALPSHRIDHNRYSLNKVRLASLKPGNLITRSIAVPEIQYSSQNDDRTFVNYRVYRGTSPTVLSQLTTTTNLTYTDNAVTNGQIYYYKVSAMYTAGESALSYLAYGSPMAATPLDFSSTFDSNNGGFFGTDDWQWGTPAYAGGPGTAYSSPNCWGTNLTGDYSTYSYSWLEKAFDLSLGTVTLNYQLWLSAESDYDYFYVCIDENGDGMYTILQSFTGASGTWLPQTVSIPALNATSYARIAFILEADSGIEYAGAYIDNFQLTSPLASISAPTGVTATLDGDDIELNWTAVSGASSYKVYGSNDPNAADWGTAIGTVTTPTFTDTSGMLFRFYKITAVSGAKVNHEVPVGKPVSTRK